MNIVFRSYRESDRSALRDLTVAAFDGVSIDHNIDRMLGPVAGRDWRWRKARQIDEGIDAPGGEIAVAEEVERGVVVGHISLRYDREARVGWIPNLAVVSDLRGQGLGRRLIEHALARFRAEGMTVARIETLEQNPIGRHLYPSVGFIEVARQIHYAISLTEPPR